MPSSHSNSHSVPSHPISSWLIVQGHEFQRNESTLHHYRIRKETLRLTSILIRINNKRNNHIRARHTDKATSQKRQQAEDKHCRSATPFADAVMGEVVAIVKPEGACYAVRTTPVNSSTQPNTDRTTYYPTNDMLAYISMEAKMDIRMDSQLANKLAAIPTR
jgi:hypothetical protein